MTTGALGLVGGFVAGADLGGAALLTDSLAVVLTGAVLDLVAGLVAALTGAAAGVLLVAGLAAEAVELLAGAPLLTDSEASTLMLGLAVAAFGLAAAEDLAGAALLTASEAPNLALAGEDVLAGALAAALAGD